MEKLRKYWKSEVGNQKPEFAGGLPRPPAAGSRRQPSSPLKFLHSKFYILHSIQRAFSLVELMIVVAVLGILAAIAFPEFQNHTQQAKEAAAKDNLRILRQAIERYALDHNGVPPGYDYDDTTQTPSGIRFYVQIAQQKTYLLEMPQNPFNDLITVYAVPDATAFPAEATGQYGWIYKASTKTIKLDWPGTDSSGQLYFDY